MRTIALTKRILKELIRDTRTLLLVFLRFHEDLFN